MCEIIHLREVDSTNTFALKSLAKYKDKTVILAETQTQGRGRFERKWISDVPNNIYMSIILKPNAQNSPYQNITQYACIVLTRVLEKYGVSSKIKWPNDILVESKKISGILSEMKFKGGVVEGFVLGIGVNLNLSQELIDSINQPATSLNLFLNKDIDKNEFVDMFLNEFFNQYDNFINKGFAVIKEEYESRSEFIGKNIQINDLQGVAKGVSDKGELIIMDEENVEKIILSGDLLML